MRTWTSSLSVPTSARRGIVAAVAVALTLPACAGLSSSLGGGEPVAVDIPSIGDEVDELGAALVTIEADDGSSVQLAARVADDRAARRQGLMGVRELPDDVGMLFTWDGGEREGGFWMRDTLIPLDIAFVSADGRIEAVLSMVPCTSDPCPSYDPGSPYVAALEVPAGWFEANGVEQGDRLSWVPATED